MSLAAHAARRGESDEIDVPGPIRDLLQEAGITVNGSRPYDIQVNDPRVFDRVVHKGSLGLGESYMDGQWDVQRLDDFIARLLKAELNQKIYTPRHLPLLIRGAANILIDTLTNRQSRSRAFQVGEEHYDIGDNVFRAMLDPTMNYSCGYWGDARSLETAQRHKMDMICQKLELKPGEHLLDIGCGWGALARYAAEEYGARVTGITVSREQERAAREYCNGLPVDIEVLDYRELDDQFDKIASVGMFEHVGPRNYREFFDVIRRLLSEDGLFLLHTIGNAVTRKRGANYDPWLNKYIFPNGRLPSAQQIAATLEPDLVIRDWHEFGADYDRTLMAWRENFRQSWPALEEKYGERFYRMWMYYLNSCAAAFRTGRVRLWQIVISTRQGHPDYRSVRPGHH